MASTIRTEFRLSNLGAGNAFLVGTIQRQQPYQVANSAEVVSDAIQVVGTSAAAVEAGGVTGGSMIVVENLSATATIEYGYDDTGFAKLGEMPPGHPPLVLPVSDPTDIYLEASAVGTNARVTVIKFTAPA